MTFGYIYEGDLNRFLAGTTSVPGPTGPLPERFACPFCSQGFSSPKDRTAHLHEIHSGERPVLQFDGFEPASHDVIRQRFSASQISLLNCTSVMIQHAGREPGEVDIRQAVRALLEQQGRLRLQLMNRFERSAAPIVMAYDLKLEVYDDASLRQADLAFVQWLGRPDPSIGDVDHFVLTEAARNVKSYSSALASYVVAVLQKDGQSSATGNSGNYRSTLNGALRELQNFDRPLANLISGFIRLSSNDVARSFRRTSSERLNLSLELLGQLSRGQTPAFTFDLLEAQGGQVVCPIDNGTSRVLERAVWISQIRRLSDDIVDQFRAELAIPSIDPLDKAKLSALWAGRALSLKLEAEAIFPLRELVGDAMFGHWAERTLEKLDD